MSTKWELVFVGQSLIERLVDVRSQLLKAACAVPPDQRQVAFVGAWDVKDLLAHLAGWDYANIDGLRDVIEGRLPSFYEHYDPGWATYNATLVRKYRTDDWGALMAALNRSQDAVGATLRCLPEPEFERQRRLSGRERPLTIAGLLRAAIRDEEEHLRQIETFLAGR